MPATREITRRSVIRAFVIGSLAGGALTALALAVPFSVGTLLMESREPLPLIFYVVVLVALTVASIVCAVGLLVTAPVWWLLHRLGLRGPITAVVLGMVMVGGAYLSFIALVADAGGSRGYYDRGGVRVSTDGRLTAEGWRLHLFRRRPDNATPG